MVNSNRVGDTIVIVAKPNHSSNWRNNKLVLLALSIPSLGAGIGFAALGAWPILPFAGAEIAALSAALYYVNWKLEYRHVITLNASAVSIDKGYYAPKRRWTFERANAALAITPERHPEGSPGVMLHGIQPGSKEGTRERVSIGEFLGRDECLSLVRILRGEMRVGSDSPTVRIDA